MKKKIFLFSLIIFIFQNIYSESYNDFKMMLHILCIRAACVGNYNAAEIGGLEDPPDYYWPEDLAELFAMESGIRTKTDTFYGVCFDYAEVVYNHIKSVKNELEQAGMKKNEFYIVGCDDNPNLMQLYDLANEENATLRMNGVYVKEVAEKNVVVHTDSKREPALNHAWIWIQRQDGVWFWIDPTWTDNLGYVVWGCVVNGREIQLKPEKFLCIEWYDYLDYFPEYSSSIPPYKFVYEDEFPLIIPPRPAEVPATVNPPPSVEPSVPVSPKPPVPKEESYPISTNDNYESLFYFDGILANLVYDFDYQSKCMGLQRTFVFDYLMLSTGVEFCFDNFLGFLLVSSLGLNFFNTGVVALGVDLYLGAGVIIDDNLNFLLRGKIGYGLYLMLDTFYIQVDYIPETSVFGRSLSVGVGFSYFY